MNIEDYGFYLTCDGGNTFLAYPSEVIIGEQEGNFISNIQLFFNGKSVARLAGHNNKNQLGIYVSLGTHAMTHYFDYNYNMKVDKLMIKAYEKTKESFKLTLNAIFTAQKMFEDE